MNRKWMLASLMMFIMLVLAACGGGSSEESNASNKEEDDAKTEENSEDGTKTIEYLGKSYEIPANAERIVITGAMEAMEDALALDVHPVGAISVGGEFPEIYTSITDKAESIGEKRQPNFEKVLELQPDVILATSKFPADVTEKLEKIATTIPVSYISTDWEANLKLMGEISGKEDKAEEVLNAYKEDVETAKASIAGELEGKKVAAVRIRAGQVFVYPQDVFVNPVLYSELGLEVPAEIEAAENQAQLSMEQLADMNPDHLFIQFAESENAEAKNALEDLQNDPIVKNITAFKEDQVYVNTIDPLLEGGPANSRVEFLKALQEDLSK
ncbi:ABC transporter substrate-binding protein [Cytobacillus sp. FSL R7-0696]|uniref:ABC transporter substrate-binding protein n=1 Tax=Cytobacillus sp. FSL R7-0696 TaxID=2921691 RepID=UPI0030F4FBF4